MDLPALSSPSDAIEENDEDDLIDIPEIMLSPAFQIISACAV